MESVIGEQVVITVPDRLVAARSDRKCYGGVMHAGESSVTGVGAPTHSVNDNVLTVTLRSPLNTGEHRSCLRGTKMSLLPTAGRLLHALTRRSPK